MKRPLQTTIVLVFSGLFFFSQFYSHKNNWIEAFPFFHWSLYTHKQDMIHDFAVTTPELIQGEEEYWIIQELGAAQEQGDYIQINQSIKELAKLTKAHSFTLSKRTLNPVNYVLRKEVIKNEVMATFRHRSND
ncbi:hypothetical protein [Peredibacter starrii]|uniref:Uncharacterized protein n=1 Tax=Peredibacter starrii TaxID=28202 RepID=A0AAX4HPV0_9BACT|nr:hypothetical protein [Peredibacter starrii]WPU65353.1 hypothetical protein SOO65_01170 [Peredibacter starrii]